MHPFELPEGHTAEVVTLGSNDGLHLSTPNEGTGTYEILSLEERGDEVIVRTGEALIKSEPAKWMSEGAPEPTGYPFPPR